MKKKGGLGKGLDAIFMENTTENGSETIILALEEITPNREQPRKEFDEEKIAELADSIRQHGILQPLLVRPMVTGGYQIVAGERRYRAARMAGLSEVPVVVRELEDAQVTELARAGMSQGLAGLFLEAHPDPDNARCDGPCALRLDKLEPFLSQLKQLDDLVKSFPVIETA